MARTIEYAGEYESSEIKLYTSTGQVIDLSNTTIEINLFEDLLRASISGSVIVADTNNIIQNATILGQEFLTLKIKTPGLDDEAIDYTEHSFCAYKIGSRTDLAQGAEVFEISLVSPELFRSVRTRISKSYTESIDKIVEDILRNPLYCNSKKQLFIEPTSGIRRLVIPNKNPFNIIKDLANESMSKETQASDYMLFETTRGIHFRSLQSLIFQPSMGEYHAGETGDFGDQKVSDIEQEFKRVIHYEIDSNNDMLANIGGGMLASRVITHDIYNKNYEVKDYGYFTNFDDQNRLEKNPVYNEVVIDEQGNTLETFPEAKLFYHPTSTTTDDKDSQHYETETSNYPYMSNRINNWISSRRSKLVELNSGISMGILINGNTTVEVGQKISFIKPLRGKSHSKDEIDTYYSGDFLITRLRHTFSQATKKHEISMVVIKDATARTYENIQDGSEPVGKTGKTITEFYN